MNDSRPQAGWKSPGCGLFFGKGREKMDRKKRWWALCITGLFLLVVFALSLDYHVKSETETLTAENGLGELTAGRRYSQKFTFQSGPMEAIEVHLATFGRTNDSRLTARLLEDGAERQAWQIDCRRLEESAYYTLRLDRKIEDPRGKEAEDGSRRDYGSSGGRAESLVAQPVRRFFDQEGSRQRSPDRFYPGASAPIQPDSAPDGGRGRRRLDGGDGGLLPGLAGCLCPEDSGLCSPVPPGGGAEAGAGRRAGAGQGGPTLAADRRFAQGVLYCMITAAG